MDELLKSFLEKLNISASDEQVDDFGKWLGTMAWKKYNDEKMRIKSHAEEIVEKWAFNIPNATKGKAYGPHAIDVPGAPIKECRFEGLEGSGLEIKQHDDGSFTIEGTPAESGDFPIRFLYKYEGWIPGMDEIERTIAFAVNPDPRSLWRDIPTSPDVPFFKADTECAFVQGDSGKCMVAASQRGRSHAQEGKPRDDHFLMEYMPETGWHIMAVADGAGSARYSRKGSEVACRAAVQFCLKRLLNPESLEQKIIEHNSNENAERTRKELGDLIYHLVGNAAFLAHRAVNEVASRVEDAKPKDFATTLMLAICKKFDFGWFIASFWVGDGAIALYDKDMHTAILLGEPDEGEFSGQTRFLTMPEIFADYTALYKRLRFQIVPDFTALMLMTDGVSDPMFGTEANLKNPDKWDELWQRLAQGFPEDEIDGVVLDGESQETAEQLLRWLSFWRPGEHDDRTIAILK